MCLDEPEALGDSSDDWKIKLVEGMKIIKEAESVAYEKFSGKAGWHVKQSKQTLVSNILSVLTESERTGYIKYRTEGTANCVFSQNW